MIGKKAAEPRPLRVKFNSYADRQLVKKGARNYLPDYLSCREDLPYAVREARKKLAMQFDAAIRDPNVKKVYIAYPARLIVDGQLVTAINPATCEPIEKRRWAPQRPHHPTNNSYGSSRKEGDRHHPPREAARDTQGWSNRDNQRNNDRDFINQRHRCGR